MPRDILGEIREIKARQGRLHRSALASRVDRLHHEWDASQPATESVALYVPVALVTAMEVFFRSLVAELVDYGSPFIDNSEPLARSIRFDLDSIRAIEGKRVTVGEIMAHSLPFNKLSDISTPLSALMGEDVFHRLGRTVDHWRTRVNGEPATPIIEDIDVLRRVLIRVFEVRHIIVHEVPERRLIRNEEVPELIASVRLLLSASHWLAFDLLTPDAPLQQIEMTGRAYADLQEADEQAKALVARLSEHIDPESRDELVEAQVAWEAYRDKESAFAAGWYRGGSAMPMVGALRARRVTEERIGRLRIP